MADIRIVFDNIPWAEIAPGARARSVVQGNVRLRLLELTPLFVEDGWCTRGHAGFVLEGRLEVTCLSTSTVLRAGDALVLPAGEAGAHRAQALTDRVVLFLVEEP